jgi:hypothetical protein
MRRSGIAFASNQAAKHKKSAKRFGHGFRLCLDALQTRKHICQQAEPQETQQLLHSSDVPHTASEGKKKSEYVVPFIGVHHYITTDHHGPQNARFAGLIIADLGVIKRLVSGAPNRL